MYPMVSAIHRLDNWGLYFDWSPPLESWVVTHKENNLLHPSSSTFVSIMSCRVPLKSTEIKDFTTRFAQNQTTLQRKGLI